MSDYRAGVVLGGLRRDSFNLSTRGSHFSRRYQGLWRDEKEEGTASHQAGKFVLSLLCPFISAVRVIVVRD